MRLGRSEVVRPLRLLYRCDTSVGELVSVPRLEEVGTSMLPLLRVASGATDSAHTDCMSKAAGSCDVSAVLVEASVDGS